MSTALELAKLAGDHYKVTVALVEREGGKWSDEYGEYIFADGSSGRFSDISRGAAEQTSTGHPLLHWSPTTSILTVAQVAARLGVNQSRVRQLIDAGRLPAEHFGRAWMIQEQDLELVRDRKPGRPVKERLSTDGAASGAPSV